MPTREELEAALREQGSNYSVGDDYPDTFVSKPLPAEWQAERTAYEKSQTAPEPTMSEPPAPKAPEPTMVPPETVSSEPNMSPPPPVSSPSAPAPKPRAAQTKAPSPQPAPAPGREALPDPAEGQVTDADILGLSTNRKNPQPAPQPGAASAQPQADGIEDTRFNASDKTRKIQAGIAEGNNRTLDLLGEKEEILAAKQGQQRDINAARSEQAIGAINDAYDRADAHKGRYEESRAQMDQELSELKQKMGNPPFDTVGLVMGLVGALAAANGKPEAGRILQQGVGNAINTKMNRWRGEIEGGNQHLEGMGKLVNMDRLAAADEEAGAAAIQKAVTAEFDAAMDQAEREAKTEQEKNAVSMLRNDFRTKLGQSEIQRRQKDAAAANRRRVNGLLAKATTQEERDAIANANGDVGRDILKDMLKQNMDQAKVGSELLGQQKTAAETVALQAKAAKDAAKAEGKPYKGFIPGKVFTSDLPSGLETKVGEKSMAYGGIRSGYNRLIELAEKVKVNHGGHWNADDVAEANKIRENMVGQESNFNGLGAPTGKEHDQVISGIADPQAFFQRADSRELLIRASRNIKSNFDESLKGVGIYDENDPKFAGQTLGTRPYRMSDGEVRDLPESQIEALKAKGYGSEVQ